MFRPRVRVARKHQYKDLKGREYLSLEVCITDTDMERFCIIVGPDSPKSASTKKCSIDDVDRNGFDFTNESIYTKYLSLVLERPLCPRALLWKPKP